MLTSQESRELEDRLKSLICPICPELQPNSLCGLKKLDRCPISIHLDGLVHIVSSVHSDRMEHYVQKVRDEVCSTCRNPLFPRTGCDLRREGHCALDAYLLPIVEVVDDFLIERERRAAVPLNGRHDRHH